MKTTRQFLLVAAVSALLGACSRTQTPETSQTVIQPAPAASAQKINCSGTVTDAAGNPVAGATVEYWRYDGTSFLSSDPELEKQINTGANGAFGFEVSRDNGFLLARKAGLAPAWKQLGQPFNPATEAENKLMLTPPGTLAGMVMDESNQPIANAEVSVGLAVTENSRADGLQNFNYLTGKPARDFFAARTDATGHFRIENFPTNASARFAVKCPGKVLRPSPEDFNGPEPSGYRAGPGRHQIGHGTGGECRRQNRRRGKRTIIDRRAGDVATGPAGPFHHCKK